MNAIRQLLLLAPLAAALSANGETWVKIAIDNSGVYEISYDDLRKMGFSDPAKVGMTGRGGAALPLNGTLAEFRTGERVPVVHENGRLYFFGNGLDNYSFTSAPGFDAGGYFNNDGRNINTPFGYYFLTDAPGMLIPMEKLKKSDNGTEVTEGVSFFAHEEDLSQNNTDTGAIFWGERFNRGEPSGRSWQLPLVGVKKEAKAVMQLRFYTELKSEGTLTVKTISDEKRYPCFHKYQNLTPFPDICEQFAVAESNEQLTLMYESAENSAGVANLDHWSVSYLRSVPSGVEPGTVIMAFPEAEGSFKAPTTTFRAMDITDASMPRDALNGNVAIHPVNGSVPVLAFYDITQPQRSVISWEPLDSTPYAGRIHAMAKEGADLIIIAPEKFLDAAQRISDIHADHDGLKTAIIESDEIYNEFSDGLPDPTAYRNMVRTFLAEGKVKPRNLLLLGPLTGRPNDPRSIGSHILVQSPTVHYERGGYGLTSFYGIASDDIDLGMLHTAHIDVATGWLPFATQSDADNYIQKLERYLYSTNHAMTLSEMLYVGGLGDNHAHARQAVNLATHVDAAVSGATVPTVIAVDAYGNRRARDIMVESLSSGKSVMTYFGHAAVMMLGKDQEFFTTSHIGSLRNHYLPFLITAGCNSTQPDKGLRGISEEMVLATEFGAIGGLASLRETWSGQNYEIVKNFAASLSHPQSAADQRPPSIGEIYVAVMSRSSNINDLAYMLMCDPAIVIPASVGNVEVNAAGILSAGEKITVEGLLTDAGGNLDSAFSGDVVVKLCAPSRLETVREMVTNPDDNKGSLSVLYADDVRSLSMAKVEHGKFVLSLTVPADWDVKEGETCRIIASAFNTTSFKGATGMTPLKSGAAPDGSQRPADSTPPVIESMTHEQAMCSVIVEVSDNEAVSLGAAPGVSPMGVCIDGKKLQTSNICVIDACENSATLLISLPELPAGEHTVAVTVTDMAGNKATSEMAITVGQAIASIPFKLKEKAVIGRATFLTGDSDTDKTIRILNMKGTTVAEIQTKDSTVVWDCISSDGTKVMPGLYKAMLTESDPTTGVKRNSDMIKVAVVAAEGQ